MRTINIIGIASKKDDVFSEKDAASLVSLMASAKEPDHYVCIPFEGSWSLVAPINASFDHISNYTKAKVSGLIGLVAKTNVLDDCVAYILAHPNTFSKDGEVEVKITSVPHQPDHQP